MSASPRTRPDKLSPREALADAIERRDAYQTRLNDSAHAVAEAEREVASLEQSVVSLRDSERRGYAAWSEGLLADRPKDTTQIRLEAQGHRDAAAARRDKAKAEYQTIEAAAGASDFVAANEQVAAALKTLLLEQANELGLRYRAVAKEAHLLQAALEGLRHYFAKQTDGASAGVVDRLINGTPGLGLAQERKEVQQAMARVRESWSNLAVKLLANPLHEERLP